MRQLDVGQRPLVGRAHVGVDDLFALRLVNRQRSGGLEVADHLRGAGPLAEQLDQLAVQGIDSDSQFFQRHFILVLLATSSQLSAFSSILLTRASCGLIRQRTKLKAES